MKRSGPLKRKTPMKRTRMKRAPQQSIGKAKKLAWMWFSRFVRMRGAWLSCGVWVNRCVTSGATLPIKSIHAGHFVPGRHNAVLYDERNCHPQSFIENVRRGGNWPAYERFMLEKYGPEVVQELKDKDREIVQMTAADHLAVAEVYRGKVAGLGGWPE